MTVFWWLSTSRVEFFGGVGKISTGSTLNLKVARCAGAWDSRGVASSRSYLNNILVKEWCLRICCCWNIAKDFVRGNLGGTWLSLCLYGRALNVRLGLDVPAMPTVMSMAELLDFVSPRSHFLLLFLLSFLVMETHQQLETEVWSVQLHCDQLAKFDRSYSKVVLCFWASSAACCFPIAYYGHINHKLWCFLASMSALAFCHRHCIWQLNLWCSKSQVSYTWFLVSGFSVHWKTADGRNPCFFSNIAHDD